MAATPLSQLGLAIAEKLKRVVAGRGITQVAAARQWGVSQRCGEQVFTGKYIPSPELAERLVLWMYGGLSFEKAPKLKTVARVRPRDTWPQLMLRLPPKLLAKLKRFSKETGYAKIAVVQLALEYFLDGSPTLVTYREAMERVSKARLEQNLAANPFLTDILRGDEELAVTLGHHMVPVEDRRAHLYQTHVRQVANALVMDGPASPIACIPEEEDRYEEV